MEYPFKHFECETCGGIFMMVGNDLPHEHVWPRREEFDYIDSWGQEHFKPAYCHGPYKPMPQLDENLANGTYSPSVR